MSHRQSEIFIVCVCLCVRGPVDLSSCFQFCIPLHSSALVISWGHPAWRDLHTWNTLTHTLAVDAHWQSCTWEKCCHPTFFPPLKTTVCLEKIILPCLCFSLSKLICDCNQTMLSSAIKCYAESVCPHAETQMVKRCSVLCCRCLHVTDDSLPDVLGGGSPSPWRSMTPSSYESEAGAIIIGAVWGDVYISTSVCHAL